MPQPEPLISLGLNTTPVVAPPAAPLPAAEALQFRRAEHDDAAPAGSAQRCLRCSKAIAGEYYHAQGKVVCPECAAALEAWQKAPKPHLLAKALLYGGGAAVAGGAIYAIVAIVTGIQLALVAILIGYMVGKAIRHACGGLGGRPQQIMAVLLTYFAISTSFIPVAIYNVTKHRLKPTVSAPAGAFRKPGQAQPLAPPSAPSNQPVPPAKSLGVALLLLLGLAVAAPFLSLSSVGGFISLFIIFVGLQRAWRMTGRVDIPITGPY